MALTSGNTAVVGSGRARVGARIRLLRTQRGWTLRELGGAVKVSHGYLSQVERGLRTPSPAVLRSLDAVLEQNGALIELNAMADETVLDRSSRSVVRQEREARRIRVFASSAIPALAQTVGYAAASLRAGLPGLPPAEIQRLAAARPKRGQILFADPPPYLWVLLDEAVLCRPVGGQAVMTEQLRWLTELAGMPSATVQVIPFHAGEYPMMGGFLTLLDLPSGGPVVQVESYGAGQVVDSPYDRALQGQRWDMALTLALAPDRSVELIHEYIVRNQ